LSAILGKLEFPKNESKIQSSYTSVIGWALSKTGDELEISILVDGEQIETVGTGIARIDVENTFPEINGAFESGFYASVNLWKFNNGNHILEVIVKSKKLQKSIGSINFKFEKKPPSLHEPIYTGPDFKKSGEKFCNEYIVKLGGLKPNHKVLDIGCSIGRLAMPLTKFLNNSGRYFGLDIVPEAIKWCSENITPKYPNFHFILSDNKSMRYNPKGKIKNSKYKFPFDGHYFDFIILSSVFTHMLPDDMENYFSEISRVLKIQSKCLITFFLLNEESLQLIDSNKSKLPFVYQLNEFRTTNKEFPEAAIAYDENFIKKLFKKNGLDIIKPIFYGGWCSRKNFSGNQDMIIGKKNN